MYTYIAPLQLTSELALLGQTYILEPFYIHAGGYKLQLEAKLEENYLNIKVRTRYVLLESEFVVKFPCKLEITTMLINQEEDRDHIVMEHTVLSHSSGQ